MGRELLGDSGGSSPRVLEIFFFERDETIAMEIYEMQAWTIFVKVTWGKEKKPLINRSTWIY